MTVFILGGGPAGMATCYYLAKCGISSIVIEMQDVVGGMARTWEWNDFLVETGPHIMHTPLSEIWNDWKELLGEDLVEKQFFSANYKKKGNKDFLFDYPLNIDQVLHSEYWDKDQRCNIKKELDGCPDNHRMGSARSFSEYVEALVGHTLSHAFFKEYPEKVWALPTTLMLPDWAPKRIRICEKREPFFTGQFCGISKFGSGTLFDKIYKFVERCGSKIKLNEKISHFLQRNGRLIEIHTSKSSYKVSRDDLVISTLPVTTMAKLSGFDCNLNFRGILSVYASFTGVKEVLPQGYDWLYFSDKSIFNRITEPTKLSNSMNLGRDDRTYIICENNIDSNSARSWSTQDIEDITSRVVNDLHQIDFLKNFRFDQTAYNLEPYVYPVQTHANKVIYKEALSSLMKIINLECIGTGANYEYNDMQVIFKQAKELALDLSSGNINGDLRMSTFASYSQSEFDKNAGISTYPSQKVEIIAEIGINHNGSHDMLVKLASQACSCADIVKIQFFKTNLRIGDAVREVNHVELAQNTDETISDLLERCEIDINQVKELKSLVEGNHRRFMATIFSISDFNEIIKLGFDCIKVASMDLNNYPLHRIIASYSAPLDVYISTGMSTLDEIKACMNVYVGTHHKLRLLNCTSSYPAPDASLNLSAITTLINQFPNAIVGYSDHSVGIRACCVAISRGAKAIEVHFTADKRLTGPDQLLSKNEQEVSEIRDFADFAVKSLGDGVKRPYTSEYQTWKTQRKGLFACRDIHVGELISYENTLLCSPPLGLSPVALEDKSQIHARVNIQKGQPITKGKVYHE